MCWPAVAGCRATSHWRDPGPHRRDGAFIGKLPHPRPITLSSALRSLPFLTASRPQPVSYACSCSAATHRIEYTSFFKPCLGTMKQTVATLIAKTLDQAGVKRIWGVTGDSLNGLSDSLHRMGTIEWLGTRHEEVAAFAAGAEAQLTGQLAVCAGSCGPGNLHLINGLFDCHRNHVPVLAIAAHIPSSEIGSGYFQKRIRRSCSANAVTIASWFPTRNSCRACWKSPCARRSSTAVSRWWSCRATWRCAWRRKTRP